MAVKVAEWRKLPLSLTELCIDTTLRCGQSFRWRKIDEEWHCVLGGRIISLKQDTSHLHYRVTWPKTGPKPTITSPPSLTHGITSPEDDTESLLRSYFALSVPLSSLYKQWAASDANFARRAPSFTGIRILNQDAWETLISFICSSNNHISRISSMVQKLCTHYGPYIGTISGEPFHDFPDAKALSGVQVQTHLRELGFGYRAKYIVETADIVANHKPPGWLNDLRNPAVPAFDQVPSPSTNATAEPPITTTPKPDDSNPLVGDANPPGPESPTYRAAHEALLTLTGVGPKVSDCVCLMGLGWGESVPVDTHVWQIAQRDYKFGGGGGGGKGKTKTLSKTMYDAVGGHFRAIWGPYAGWAQSVLFTANLKSFAEQAEAGKKNKTTKDGVLEEEVEGERVTAAVAVVKNEQLEVNEGVKKEEVAVSVVENTSKRAVRKRKSVAVETQETSRGKKRVKTVEVEVTARRTSQRIRATRK
ncbi:DNA glycosylase [Chaetomium sp. MPI-SDFR-AT-0129]|nr:DNA glycosylase [Chaetomium sp. MPI-SDFR-AT-0129]